MNYWDVDVPTYTPAERPLKSHYDAVVVGLGFSGLAVAYGLAKSGLSVLGVDAADIGHGASSRNGGMVGPSFHSLGMSGLTGKYGPDKAQKIMRAGIDALEYCQGFFTQAGFDANFDMSGRFRGARSEADLRAMIRECEALKASVGLEYRAVGPQDVAAETGSATYCGGVVYPRDGGVHPKKLVNAIAALAEKAGAQLMAKSPVQALHRRAKSHEIDLCGTRITAGEVVLATNGYSTRQVHALNKRIVPITVSVATTRDLGPERIRALSPRLQMHGESGRVFIWSRPSPDHRRFLFGGRISDPAASPERQAEQIATAVQRIYPDLGAEDFDHVWNGKIAYTSDHSPHLNKIDGLWMLGGYCGSGVTRSFYFADKLVRKITGQPGADTPFDDIAFPTVPFRPFAPFGARMLTEILRLAGSPRCPKLTPRRPSSSTRRQAPTGTPH